MIYRSILWYYHTWAAHQPNPEERILIGHARTGRTKPSTEVTELIRKALKRIGEMNLTSAIHEYFYQIGVEGSSERPMSPEDFFGGKYSQYTLVPIHMLENSEDGIS